MMIHRSPEAGALIPNLTRKFSHDGSGNPLVCLGPRRTASCPCSPTTRARAPGSWLPGLFACICIHLCEMRMHRHTRRITRSRRSVSTPVQNTQGPRHTAPTPQGPLCAGGGGRIGDARLALQLARRLRAQIARAHTRRRAKGSSRRPATRSRAVQVSPRLVSVRERRERKGWGEEEAGWSWRHAGGSRAAP